MNPTGHGPSPALRRGVVAARVLLGGLFVFAGVMKLRDPQSFYEGVRAFKLLPDDLAAAAAFIAPWTEILAGGALLLGVWARSAALLIGAMLVAFIMVICSALARGLDVTCSCFGEYEFPCRGAVGPCHIARNTVMLGMAAAIIAFAPRGPGGGVAAPLDPGGPKT